MRYIKKIILENFQSHKYSVIELNEELNVIVGPSDSGKSAIIRGLKWALYNEPSGDYFIREGEREASVTVEFSDNVKVKRYRSKSKNSYHLFNRDGEEIIYEGFGTNVPEQIIETIGIKKIHLDSDESAAINLGEQLDGAFLLSEKTSVRASAIGRLVGVNVIDDALREGLKDNRNISLIRKNLDSTIMKIELELEKYDYLASLSKRMNKAEKLKILIQETNRRLDKIASINNQLNINNLLLKETEKYINCFNDIQTIDDISMKIQQLYLNYKYYTNKKIVYDTVKANIIEESYTVNKLVDLQLVNETSKILSDLLIKSNNLNKINHIIIKYKNELKICNNTIEKLKHISHIKNIDTYIDKNLIKLLNLKKLNIILNTNRGNISKGELYVNNFYGLKKLDPIMKELITSNSRLAKLLNIDSKDKISTIEIEKSKTIIIKNDSDIEEKLDKYRELMSKQEVCPFCLSQIDEEKVNHIIEHYK